MPRLAGLQMLRALAALMVLTGHILAETAHFSGLPMPASNLPWSRGVDIFFVISGFIITLSATRHAADPARFLWRRFLRVAPLYYLFTTLMAAVLLLMPGGAKDTGLEPGQILSSYLFLPYERHDGRIAPVLSLGWTLNYELFFYLLCAACLFLRRPFAALSALLIAFSLASLWPWQGTALRFWTNPLILEFLFGTALAQLYLRDIRLPSLPLALSAVAVGLGLLVVLHGSLLPRFLAAGLPALLIAAGGTIFCPAVAAGRWQPLQLLGDASYALYLSHRFALRSLTLLLLPFLPATPAAAWCFAAAASALCLALGLLVHARLEKPLLARLAHPRIQQAAA